MATESHVAERTKRRLGRGLSSLIGEPIVVAVPDPGSAPPQIEQRPRDPLVTRAPIPQRPPGDTIELIDTARIVPNRFQPRTGMDGPALDRLAESIRRSGVVQPVIVRRPAPGGGAARDAEYELVAGERRWRAAQRAGLARIPALIRDLPDEAAAEWALVENLQREDLNAMDRAHALRALCQRFALSQADAADRVGLDRSTVANLIRLTELEPPIADLLRAGRLSAGHGKAILAAPAGPARTELARRAAEHAWTVRRLEHAAAAANRAGAQGPAEPAPGAPTARTAARADIERRLAEHLGTRIAIQADRSGARGRIVIDFYDLDHFEGLMSKLGLPGEMPLS